MEKDTHLINIYLKIHNKQTLTMDDLAYLAWYSPECFEKTCKNVVYNIPEAKPLMESETAPPPNEEGEPEPSERQNIEKVLENIKRLEMDDFCLADIEPEKVKSLLGNLYMEMLFPHNGQEAFMDAPDKERKPTFDKRA